MKNTSKISSKTLGKLSSTDTSSEAQEEKINETVDCAVSLSDLPIRIRKKEAGKPMYLTRYE